MMTKEVLQKIQEFGICLPKGVNALLMDKKTAKALLPLRKRNSHKGDYGRAAIVAGSIDYTGAAYLSALVVYQVGGLFFG